MHVGHLERLELDFHMLVAKTPYALSPLGCGCADWCLFYKIKGTRKVR